MDSSNILRDILHEFLENIIKESKSYNAKEAENQIECILSNQNLPDDVKDYLIFAILNRFKQEQQFQKWGEFLLGISRALNEASKIAKHMAKNQEK